jgi:hypothetical protein
VELFIKQMKESLEIAKQSEEAQNINFNSNQEALAVVRQMLDDVKKGCEEAEKFYDMAVTQQKLGLDKLAHAHCSRVEDRLGDLIYVASKAAVIAHRVVETKPDSLKI